MSSFPSIFIISLPECVDRQKYVGAQLKRLGLSYEILDAVDGRGFDVGAHPAYDKKRRLFYGRDLTGGELGCTLSHRKAMEEIIARDLPYGIILEDDVLLTDDFKNVVEALLNAHYPWEVVRFLGKDKIKQMKKRELEDLGDGYTLSRLATAPGGTYAYIVTQKAAKRLVAKMQKNMIPVDALIGWSWWTGLANLTIQPGIANQSPEIDTIIGEKRYDKTLQVTGLLRALYPLTRFGLKLYEGIGKKISFIGSAPKDKRLVSRI